MLNNQALHIAITGADGNLGRKLTLHALAAPWCRALTCIDKRFSQPALTDAKLHVVRAHLADPFDDAWRATLFDVDVIWHLAAQHPYPDATWADSAASVDMTLHLLDAIRGTRVQRLVFASSNHVMGGYKDGPLQPAMLRTDMPPRPGTRFREAGGGMQDSTPYATAKLMNERICLAATRAAGTSLTALCVRIGWCRPGDNRPEDISLALIPGVSSHGAADAQALQDLRWVRDMWLSNSDLCHLFEQCARADSRHWPARGLIVNGNSANRNSVWDGEAARRWLHYAPQDDLYDHIGGPQ